MDFITIFKEHRARGLSMRDALVAAQGDPRYVREDRPVLHTPHDPDHPMNRLARPAGLDI